MINYLVHRLGQALVTLVLASILIFVGVRALPGDPALAMAGEEADPAVLESIRADLGLNESLPVQYLAFVKNVLQGDLGTSAATGIPVTDLVATTLPVTIWLSLYAIAVAVLIGVTAGVVAALYRGRWPEWIAQGFTLVGLSVPSFWLGILAILYLAVGLRWFPASGYVPLSEEPFRSIYYLTLPALVLGTALAAVLMRQTRASMLEALSSDYVRTARAKGMGERAVVTRFALRNSLVVVVTIIGLQLGGLLSGAVVTERIFGLPGFGKLTLDSVFTRDYAVIQAVVIIATFGYVFINLMIDLAYSLLDPRIRVGGHAR